jgi:hypothetical protein
MRAAADLRAELAAGIAALGLLFSSLEAAETTSVTRIGTLTDSAENRWVLNSTGQLERGSLPIRRGMVLNLQIDGRSFALNPTSPNSKSEKATASQDPPIPDELKNDVRFIFRFPEDMGMRWIRYVRLDSARRGVRFIDVLENTGASPHSLVLNYVQEMDVSDSDFFQGAATDRGVVLSRGNPALPDDTSGVILQFSPELSPAMPMFVFGKSRDTWTEERRLDSYQLKLERSATLEPGKRAILIHWIGCKRPQEKGKAEKAFERFIVDGHLIDSGVPTQWHADVINFTPESLAPAAGKKDGLRLVMLEQLCKRLKTEPGSTDILFLEPGSQIEGDFTAAKITLARGSSPLIIPIKNIAALSGGAGKGRTHRLFLRDGSVLMGTVTLESAKLKSRSVGEVSLNADSLDHLLIRQSPQQGKSTAGAGLVVTSGGELLRIDTLPSTPLSIRTAAGAFELPWLEIATIGERSPTDPGFTISLKDGSRIAGLPQLGSVVFSIAGGAKPDATDPLRFFAAEEKDLEPLLNNESDETEIKPEGGWCAMAHDTLWAGSPADDLLELEAAGGITRFDSTALIRVRRHSDSVPASGAAITFDVELTNGLKLRGRFLSPTLRWKRGDRALDLPWSQVTELQTRTAAP